MGILPVLLTLAALLSGCDRVPLTPREAIEAARPFEPATRTAVERRGTEGQVWELKVVSRREASWRDADRALWSDLRRSCPDGQPSSTLLSEPAESTSTEIDAKHPRGTVFRRIVVCPPTPDFELALPEGTTEELARALFRQRLNEGNEGFPREPLVLPLRFSRHAPKHVAMSDALGWIMLRKLGECPQGVEVERLLVGVLPPAPDDARRSDGYLALIASCRGEPDETLPPPFTEKEDRE